MHGMPGPGPQARLTLAWFLAQLAAGTIGGFVSGMVCLFVGIVIGGNVATDFEFAGTRGYEATGGIGLLIGLILGAPAWVYLVGRRWDTSARYLPALAGSLVAALLAGAAILLSARLRLTDSVFPLAGLIALGSIIGYHSRLPFHVTRYAAVIAILIGVGSAYLLSQQRFVPSVSFVGELAGGTMTRLTASGDQGSKAFTASSIATAETGQLGTIELQFSQCVRSAAPPIVPQVTARGEHFKPAEVITIRATYTRADCTTVFLTARASADADGSFMAELAPVRR